MSSPTDGCLPCLPLPAWPCPWPCRPPLYVPLTLTLSLPLPLSCRPLAAHGQKKEFPYNLEQCLFGRELNIPVGPERKAAILRVALQQLLGCLEKCHAVGERQGRGRALVAAGGVA